MFISPEKIFNKSQRIEPVSPKALLKVENMRATLEFPQRQMITQSARTFVVRGDANNPRLVPSDLIPGGWEIDSRAPLLRGLPIKSGVYGETIRQDQKITRPSSTPVTLEPHIPEWLTRGYHPILAPRQTHASERKTRKGRAIDHGDSTYIFNGDSRIPIYPTNFPECCICKIIVYTSSVPGGAMTRQHEATGFLVGPRLLMTSGHAKPPKPYAEAMIEVIPANYNGESVIGSEFYTYATNYVSYNGDPGSDLMLCRLYDPVGDSVGYFGAIGYNDDWQGMNVFAMCGYPFDFGWEFPCIETGIAVVDDDSGHNIKLPNGGISHTTQIETKADTASGASGSPIYSWFSDGELYAIGVNKGVETDFEISWAGFTDLHQVSSGGNGFVELIRWGRANWP